MTLNIKSLFKEIHKKRFSFQLLGSGSGCHIKKELQWKAWPTFRRGASIKVNLDSMTLRKPLSRTWKIGLCTSNNGFSLPLFASADTTRSFPFLLLFFAPLFLLINLHSFAAFHLNSFSAAVFAEDDSHPESAGDDECASPKWMQSIVISGCCYFLRGAHQSFIIGCQSGWDGVGRG